MLGRLEHAPVDEVLLDRQVGDGAVVAARRTERIGAVGRHQPVADAVHEIGAKAIARPDTASAFHTGVAFGGCTISDPAAAL